MTARIFVLNSKLSYKFNYGKMGIEHITFSLRVLCFNHYYRSEAVPTILFVFTVYNSIVLECSRAKEKKKKRKRQKYTTDVLVCTHVRTPPASEDN